jgi:hypothetical protein
VTSDRHLPLVQGTWDEYWHALKSPLTPSFARPTEDEPALSQRQRGNRWQSIKGNTAEVEIKLLFA